MYILVGYPLTVDYLADIMAKHGAFGNTLSHIDTALSTREMFNILENRMKTDLNLSNSSDLKGPRHLVSLNLQTLKIKYYTDIACTRIKTATVALWLRRPPREREVVGSIPGSIHCISARTGRPGVSIL